MALPWKIHRDGALVGATAHAEDAAALVAVSGSGTVKCGRVVVWREGEEAFPAGDSYDQAAAVMAARVLAGEG